MKILAATLSTARAATRATALSATLASLAAFGAWMPAAQAAQLQDCDFKVRADAIVEPWDAHTRTFSNDKVRIALLDTIEPAAGAFYLMIMSPPYDELGGKTCGIVAEGDGQIGFSGMYFQQLGASYDPSVGLTFRVPIERFAPATGGFDPAILAVSVNQATGRYSAVFEIP